MQLSYHLSVSALELLGNRSKIPLPTTRQLVPRPCVNTLGACQLPFCISALLWELVTEVWVRLLAEHCWKGPSHCPGASLMDSRNPEQQSPWLFTLPWRMITLHDLSKIKLLNDGKWWQMTESNIQTFLSNFLLADPSWVILLYSLGKG
jgi:hypothetical protein